MPLTILNVAYPLAPVGLDAVGGAEQVLAQLDLALTRAGHRSIVVACEDSCTAGALVPTPRQAGELETRSRCAAMEHHREAIGRALKNWKIDVVHLHGIDFYDYIPEPPVPVLATLHLPPHWYPPEVFRLNRLRTFVHCVSAAQRRACPPCSYMLPEIENGVPPELFLGHHAKRQFALCLGRICSEKGFHIALESAKRASFPLLLAGEVFRYPAHEQYFQQEIRPRLDGKRRFIGPIPFKRKRRLLTAASCLLVPSLVPETSSLVTMEALACGTPVIAFPSGALAELVEHGRTGFLVNNEVEMAESIRACASILPDACRIYARKRFSLQQMIEKYFAVYSQVAQSERINIWEEEASGSIARDKADGDRRGSNYGAGIGNASERLE